MVDHARESSNYTIQSGGFARFIRSFSDTANTTGINIDLSEIQYEVLLGVTSYIKIQNTGSNAIYVAFDSDFSEIDINDNMTYNLKISNLEPYNEIEIDGQASKISLKAENASSTFDIITW